MAEKWEWEKEKNMTYEKYVRTKLPMAHCAPLDKPEYPNNYVIRATWDEWAETLGLGPDPPRAWKDAAIKLGIMRIAA